MSGSPATDRVSAGDRAPRRAAAVPATGPRAARPRRSPGARPAVLPQPARRRRAARRTWRAPRPWRCGRARPAAGGASSSRCRPCAPRPPRRLARQAAGAVVHEVVAQFAPGRVRPARPCRGGRLAAVTGDRQRRRLISQPARRQARPRRITRQPEDAEPEHLPRVHRRRRAPRRAAAAAADPEAAVLESRCAGSTRRRTSPTCRRRLRPGRVGPGMGGAAGRWSVYDQAARRGALAVRRPAGSARTGASRSPGSTAPARRARRGW